MARTPSVILSPADTKKAAAEQKAAVVAAKKAVADAQRVIDQLCAQQEAREKEFEKTAAAGKRRTAESIAALAKEWQNESKKLCKTFDILNKAHLKDVKAATTTLVAKKKALDKLAGSTIAVKPAVAEKAVPTPTA